MSSPFEPGTKRDSAEETLQAIERTTTWASRIDTRNEVEGVDVSAFVEELRAEKERIRGKYRIKTTEVAVDNFVFNKPDLVVDILVGNLDEKVDALGELEGYIADDFGYERPLSLSKEELVWLVAQEVKYHTGKSFGVDRYQEEPFTSMSLDDEGQRPEEWEEAEFPQYNRNS